MLSSGEKSQPKAPSPYLTQFVRSNYKKTGTLNDSLDKLKLDFMQGYNDAMAESDAAYRLDTQKTKQRLMQSSQAAGGGRSGALQQMLAGGQAHMLGNNQPQQSATLEL